MLSLNVAKIRPATGEAVHFEKDYEPEALGGERENFSIVEPVRLSFDIYKDKDQFRLVGRVATMLELTCSRCLEPFRMEVDSPFDLRYYPRTENVGEGERDVEEDDLTTAFYENDTIDLGQLMHEQIYLALPMKPLCAADCRGLCPQCGSNRNRVTCICPSDWDDPRLAALKKFSVKEHKGQ